MIDVGVFHVIKSSILYELQQDEDGSFAINVPALPGCISVGDSIEEALAMIQEAMVLWLEVAREEGYSFPAQFDNV